MAILDMLLVSLKDWSFYIQLFVCSFATVMLLGSFENKNFKYKLINLGLVYLAFFASSLLFSALSVYITPLRGLNFTLSYLLVVILYTAFFCKEPASIKIILASVSFTLICIVLEFAYQTMVFLYDFIGNSTFKSALVKVVSYLLIFVFTIIATRHSLKDFSDIPSFNIGVILFETVLINGFVFYREKAMLGTGKDNLLFISLAFFFVFFLASYLLVYISTKEHYYRLNYEIENELLESDKQVLAVSGKAIEEMREVRHDIKNQYSIIQTLINEKKYDEANEYLSNFISQPIFSKAFVKSGNETVDSVLNMEKLKADSYETNIRYDVHVPEKFIFTVSDFSRILVNLIDNAIEETARSKEGKNEIDVKINTRENTLYICVKNPLKHEINEHDLHNLNTSKNDRKNHGFGQKIVARIVSKYNGYIEYSVNNGYFMAEIFLSMKGE